MSSGWGNDPGGPGSDSSRRDPNQPDSGQPDSGQPGYQGPAQSGQGPTQPGYQGQPEYPVPPPPGYGPPQQPGYGAPQQPGYGAPQQPGYGAPPPPGYGLPGQPGYPAAPPPSGRPPWLGAAVLGIIVVLVVGGFFLFRDRLSGDVTSLATGECFDTPTDETAEVSDVQRQPCNEPHDAEVIASLTHPAPAGEAYPVVSGFDDYIQENCVPAFNSYTGRNWDTDTELTLSFFRPTMSGWSNGDRGFTCFVTRIDEAKLTSSVRGGAGSSP